LAVQSATGSANAATVGILYDEWIMRNWTEQDVIERLNEGWLLSGDIGADAPFSLINPSQTRADFVPSIEVGIVRTLHEKGALVPAAVTGKKIMYRRNPRQGQP
jgi:hypothetical protein